MILIWRFGEHVKIAKLTYAIIDLFILQTWVSLHTEMKSANLKSRQQRFLSKLPNIMFANISAYTVVTIIMLLAIHFCNLSKFGGFGTFEQLKQGQLRD